MTCKEIWLKMYSFFFGSHPSMGDDCGIHEEPFVDVKIVPSIPVAINIESP